MSRNFISINQELPYGNELKRCLNSGQQFLDALIRLKEVSLNNIDVTAPVGQRYLDWKALIGATRTATETNGDESGETSHNLIAGCVAAVDVSAVNNFLKQIG